jgi:uncharacterized protein (DUF427 family)
VHRPDRIEPGPGEESIWDYPRPPRVERTTAVIDVVCNDIVVAHSTNAWRVLEKGHPPEYYIPPDDIVAGSLRPSSRRPSFCEFKGLALFFNIVAADEVEREAAWAYPRPSPRFEMITDHVAFHPDRVDACHVDGDVARGEPGARRGGWITSRIVGPFKGPGGTYSW